MLHIGAERDGFTTATPVTAAAPVGGEGGLHSST
jgi:hypothetical protein